MSEQVGLPDSSKAEAAGLRDPLRRSLDAIVGPPVDEETGAPATAATTDLFGQETVPVRAYGSHESSRALNDEWLTPRHIIDTLGPFDLDPCAPIKRPWDTAAQHFTIADDGMRQEWFGFVWMNPPYTDWRRWMHKLAEHGNGIALIFARTETRDFHEQVWAKADALLFLKGRLRFCRVNGKPADSAGAPSVLIAYGPWAAERLRTCGLAGHFLSNVEEAS